MRPRPPPRCRRWWCASARLPDHLDGVHRALLEAGSTPGAAVVVEAVSVSHAELDHRILRAGGQAAVTLEAVAAGEAAPRLEDGLHLAETPDNLGEVGHPLHRLALGLLARERVGEVPGMQAVEARHRVHPE